MGLAEPAKHGLKVGVCIVPMKCQGVFQPREGRFHPAEKVHPKRLQMVPRRKSLAMGGSLDIPPRVVACAYWIMHMKTLKDEMSWARSREGMQFGGR